jgi:hypothetical protein
MSGDFGGYFTYALGRRPRRRQQNRRLNRMLQMALNVPIAGIPKAPLSDRALSIS